MLARDDDDDVTARANAKSIYSCGADMYNCAYTRVCVYKDQSPHLGIRQDSSLVRREVTVRKAMSV